MKSCLARPDFRSRVQLLAHLDGPNDDTSPEDPPGPGAQAKVVRKRFTTRDADGDGILAHAEAMRRLEA